MTPAEIDNLRADINDMKSLMGRMVEAMTHLALIDDRQKAMSALNDKLVGRLEAMEQRQNRADIAAALAGDTSGRLLIVEKAIRDSHIEMEQFKASMKTGAFIGKVIWAVVGSSLAAAVVTAFFLRNINQPSPPAVGAAQTSQPK